MEQGHSSGALPALVSVLKHDNPQRSAGVRSHRVCKSDVLFLVSPSTGSIHAHVVWVGEMFHAARQFLAGFMSPAVDTHMPALGSLGQREWGESVWTVNAPKLD